MALSLSKEYCVGGALTIQRVLRRRRSHYSKSTASAALSLFKEYSRRDSESATDAVLGGALTIQRVLRRWRSHYLESTVSVALSLFKEYCVGSALAI